MEAESSFYSKTVACRPVTIKQVDILVSVFQKRLSLSSKFWQKPWFLRGFHASAAPHLRLLGSLLPAAGSFWEARLNIEDMQSILWDALEDAYTAASPAEDSMELGQIDKGNAFQRGI